MSDPEHHGEAGLEGDLEIMRQQIQRRQAIGFLAGGAALLTGTLALAQGFPGMARQPAGPSAGGRSSSSSSSRSSASSSRSTSTSASTSSSSAATSGSCVAEPKTTNGPYPADGSNSSSGSTSDVLTANGVVRSDIRSSFISSTTTAAGLALTLTITLVNTNNSCAPLSGYAIYIWCCTANGLYSLYTVPAESYLRGVQVTDANGQVTFTLIYPGCYSGRWPHIHFEVYQTLAQATTYKNAKLISQIAMPSDISSAVYNGVSTYSSSVSNFRQVTLASDNVFNAFTAAQLSAATPSLSGNTSSGYTGSITLGLAA